MVSSLRLSLAPVMMIAAMLASPALGQDAGEATSDSVTPEQILAGSNLFNGGSCIICHAIAGKGSGTRAPDLSDVEWLHSQGDLDGILQTISQVGEAMGVPERAEQFMVELAVRLDRVRELVADIPRPTVLGIEWLDPPFIPGHWVPEMIEIAGGSDLMGSTGQRSVQVGWSELGGLDPDVLLIMPCGYDLDAARNDAHRYADRLREVAPRAISEGRAFVVDASSYFNRSGPRVVDGVEILAALLNPGRFPDAHLEGRGAVWNPPDTEA